MAQEVIADGNENGFYTYYTCDTCQSPVIKQFVWNAFTTINPPYDLLSALCPICKAPILIDVTGIERPFYNCGFNAEHPLTLGDQLNPDSNFTQPGLWTFKVGWSITNGILSCLQTANKTSYASIDINFKTGTFYMVKFTLDSIGGPSVFITVAGYYETAHFETPGIVKTAVLTGTNPFKNYMRVKRTDKVAVSFSSLEVFEIIHF